MPRKNSTVVVPSHCSKIAKSLDKLFPGRELYEKFRYMKAMAMNTLRLLYYLKPEVGANGIVADAHVDRNTLSIAVAETAPGLYFLGTDGTRADFHPAERNRAVTFFGAKAPKLMPEFRPLFHDVRDDRPPESAPRLAIVFFGHTDTELTEEFRKSRRLVEWRVYQATGGKELLVA